MYESRQRSHMSSCLRMTSHFQHSTAQRNIDIKWQMSRYKHNCRRLRMMSPFQHSTEQH